jgi:hypothetical protein
MDEYAAELPKNNYSTIRVIDEHFFYICLEYICLHPTNCTTIPGLVHNTIMNFMQKDFANLGILATAAGCIAALFF